MWRGSRTRGSRSADSGWMGKVGGQTVASRLEVGDTARPSQISYGGQARLETCATFVGIAPAAGLASVTPGRGTRPTEVGDISIDREKPALRGGAHSTTRLPFLRASYCS